MPLVVSTLEYETQNLGSWLKICNFGDQFEIALENMHLHRRLQISDDMEFPGTLPSLNSGIQFKKPEMYHPKRKQPRGLVLLYRIVIGETYCIQYNRVLEREPNWFLERTCQLSLVLSPF